VKVGAAGLGFNQQGRISTARRKHQVLDTMVLQEVKQEANGGLVAVHAD
jgi:hypothetical protein